MINSRSTQAVIFAGILALILLVTWFVYQPGLKGGFLFDDFANLPALGYYGQIDNARSLWLYLTSGPADPTGRPIALLSFLLDARNWPADPGPFKRTSILLHLLNGALLIWLLLKLGRATGRTEAQSVWAAALGAALWLLHPLFVSTTLYIVQRETILSATFVLLGLIGYTSGRELLANNRMSGLWLAGVSIVLFTLLATLSKANGILLPLLALLVDRVLLTRLQPHMEPRAERFFGRLRRTVLVFPTLVLATYLTWTGIVGVFHAPSALRSWTIGERLLSESRVLVEYLGHLWLPRALNGGLFNDDFVVSTGLLSPPTTLLSVIAIVALLFFAFRMRERHPESALAILFFIAGHLLESTVIPLELYFEHRNYLPAILMFWPLALWICGSRTGIETNSDVFRAIRLALAFLLPLGLAVMTGFAANMWGNTPTLVATWAVRNEDSPRAQATAAQTELAQGKTSAAIARLERAMQIAPQDIQLALNMIGAKCQANALTDQDIVRAARALRESKDTGRLGYEWFDQSISVAAAGSCSGLSLDVLDTLLEAQAENAQTRSVPGRNQDRLHIMARVALQRGDADRGLELFNAAYDADPRPEAAMQQAAILASAKWPTLALKHLDYFAAASHPPHFPFWTMQALHRWLMWKFGYWDEEVSHLRLTIEQDIETQSSKK